MPQTTAGDGIRDVVIIDSGPAGYTAVLYTARAQLNRSHFSAALL